MRIDYDDGGIRDILIGKETFVADGVRVVDWRNAPISRVFYQARQGETFDVEIADREISGEILVRRTVSIQERELKRVVAPEGSFLRVEGEWRDLGNHRATLEGGQGAAFRADNIQPQLGAQTALERTIREDKQLNEIAALLDPEQFKLITRSTTGMVAIQGSAGSGKTTVGLHRLAFSHSKIGPAIDRRECWFSFSAKPLHATSPTSCRLLVLRVFRCVPWAAGLRIGEEPVSKTLQKRSEQTPASVVRFKSHSCLIPMLDQSRKRIRAFRNAPEAFDDLFTDIRWIREGIEAHAPGQFSETQVREIHRWCADQFHKREDAKLVLEEKGDGRGAGGEYDPEDDMILLRIQQLRVGKLFHKPGKPLQYDHILVDEAQDFSPLELMVLKGVAKEASMTLAGDTAQIVHAEHSSDWTEVLDAIGESHVSLSPLAISYRSNPANHGSRTPRPWTSGT